MGRRNKNSLLLGFEGDSEFSCGDLGYKRRLSSSGLLERLGTMDPGWQHTWDWNG
jgi:hypothetical protein